MWSSLVAQLLQDQSIMTLNPMRFSLNFTRNFMKMRAARPTGFQPMLTIVRP
jgi:hypothetical protein